MQEALKGNYCLVLNEVILVKLFENLTFCGGFASEKERCTVIRSNSVNLLSTVSLQLPAYQ